MRAILVHPARLLSLLAALALALLLPASARAQTPEPPAINLDAPRYDAARDLYLLDFVHEQPESISELQVSVVDPQGVVAARLNITPIGRNQSVELDAGSLKAGETYRIEVIGFDAGGKLITGSQGAALLASREFTHLPGQTQLGDLRFKLDSSGPALIIELEASGGQAAGYRVLLESSATHTVSVDVLLPASLPLDAPLAGVPAGEYFVTVIALDAEGRELAQANSEFTFAPAGPALGEPLFKYRDDPPTLLIRLQVTGGEAIAGYSVSMVEKETNQVLLDRTVEGGGQEIEVPLGNLPAGAYSVLVRALDAQGRELVSAQGETTYIPPAPPSLPARVQQGMADYPLIPASIVTVLLALSGWLILHTVQERRATATPVLEGWDIPGPGPAPLPVDPSTQVGAGSSATGSPDATLPSGKHAQPPALQLTVSTSPDGAMQGKTVQVKRFPFLLGRETADLRMDGDLRVSSRHARLGFDGGGLFIEDLLTDNGTYVDGERIPAHKRVALDPRKATRISLGSRTHLLLGPADKHTPGLPAASPAGDSQQASQ